MDTSTSKMWADMWHGVPSSGSLAPPPSPSSTYSSDGISIGSFDSLDSDIGDNFGLGYGSEYAEQTSFDLSPEISTVADAALDFSALSTLPYLFGAQVIGGVAASDYRSDAVSNLIGNVQNQSMSTDLGAKFLANMNYAHGMATIDANTSSMNSTSFLGPLNLVTEQSSPTMLQPNDAGYVYNSIPDVATTS
jgi:hypothetical protein